MDRGRKKIWTEYSPQNSHSTLTAAPQQKMSTLPKIVPERRTQHQHHQLPIKLVQLDGDGPFKELIGGRSAGILVDIIIIIDIVFVVVCLNPKKKKKKRSEADNNTDENHVFSRRAAEDGEYGDGDVVQFTDKIITTNK